VPRLRAHDIEDPEAFGRRLRDCRQRRGMTQRELAFQGCTAAYISRMEAGHRVPSLEIVRRLAERLAVNDGYLLGREASAARLRTAQELEAEVAVLLQPSDEAQDAVALPARKEIDPADLPTAALELEARALLAAGDAGKAVELVREAVARATERPGGTIRHRALLARALVEAGREEEALPILEALVERSSALPLRERAREEWELARRLHDEHRPAAAERHLLRAEALADAAHEALAAADAAELLAGLPAGRRRADLVEILDGAIQFLDAVDERERALAVKVVLASALLERGERGRADALAAEVVASLDGTSVPGTTRLLAADLLAQLDDDEPALAAYRLAIASLETRGASASLRHAYRQAAALLKKSGRMEEAFALLERALDTGKNSAEPPKDPAEESSVVHGLVEA
jgi:transcriptional regulator with XRE-family HTH domain